LSTQALEPSPALRTGRALSRWLALRELAKASAASRQSWLGEEVPLDAFAAELVENSELVIALHSLGGAREPERSTEVDKPADHGPSQRPGDPVDEGLVDLHDADGQVSQVMSDE